MPATCSPALTAESAARTAQAWLALLAPPLELAADPLVTLGRLAALPQSRERDAAAACCGALLLLAAGCPVADELPQPPPPR